MSNALHKESWQYKRFFEAETDITHIYTTYLDNLENLSGQFVAKAEKTREQNLKKYNKKFLGQHYQDLEDALWNWKLIDDSREMEAPESMDRIVVAVDPAVTSNKNSDETGIVVCGKKGDQGYVLKDISGKYTPNGWASKAIGMYHKFSASRIIGEVNNGGDLIETTLRNQEQDVSYKSVRASRGKAIRAEPIVSLYEHGKIHHIGYLPALETELTSWVPDKDISPNRLDALVWGFSELFNKKQKKYKRRNRSHSMTTF